MKEELAVDAAVLQERDSFTGVGWVKAIAPAKVNLRLAIGQPREDGYHEAVSIMHALALHDTVYLRRSSEAPRGSVSIRMVGCGDVAAPQVPAGGNIAERAAVALRQALAQRGHSVAEGGIDIRIEKNIPAQAGLGGGSSDAAAVLVGLAKLWGLKDAGIDFADGQPSLLDEVARTLGADVAFFLHGGCAYLDGVGDRFCHALAPRCESVIIVKPEGGVSTAAAYAAFDRSPVVPTAEDADLVLSLCDASQVELFNNLAPAAESLMPELGDIRRWLEGMPGVRGALLSGSGSATFAVCDSFDAACATAAAARARGLWARTTAFASIRAAVC